MVSCIVVATGQVEADIGTVPQTGVAAPFDPEVGRKSAGTLGFVKVKRFLQYLAVIELCARALPVAEADDRGCFGQAGVAGGE